MIGYLLTFYTAAVSRKQKKQDEANTLTLTNRTGELVYASEFQKQLMSRLTEVETMGRLNTEKIDTMRAQLDERTRERDIAAQKATAATEAAEKAAGRIKELELRVQELEAEVARLKRQQVGGA